MDDAQLIEQFESLALPFAEWTHRAHVRVAYCYLSRLSLEEGTAKLRAGIKRYNAANNVPEGPTSGYNETTTVAFAKLIYATIHAYGKAMPTVDSQAFCDLHTQLMNRQVLRLFYSPQQRMHPDAKTQFVEPDLTALPNIENVAIVD